MARKGKYLLTVEIGDRIVKVSAFSDKGKSTVFQKSFVFDMAEGLVSDGDLVDIEVIKSLIHDGLEKNGYSLSAHNYSLRFVVASTKIVSREVSFPKIKSQKKLKEMIKTNAQDHFPVDLSNYAMDYKILNVPAKDETQVRVLITVAPKNLIVNYLKLARELGVTLVDIDHVANAQYQVAKKIANDGVTMYVNIDISSTLVTFMNKDTLLLQRSFPFGGSDFVYAIESVLDGKDDFQHLLKICGNADYATSLLTGVQLNTIHSRLVSGISRSIDFFKSSYQNTTVEKVVLMGPCAQLYQLKDDITRQISIETVNLEDLYNVKNLHAYSELTSYVVSTIGSAISPLNLVTPELFGKQKKAGIQSGTTILIFGLVVSVGLAGYSYYTLNQTQTKRDEMNDRVNELQPVVDTYNMYNSYTQMMTNYVNLESNYDQPNRYLLDFITNLEDYLPSNISVLTASFDNTSVTVNVTVGTYEDAVIMVSNLRKDDPFEYIGEMSISTLAEEEEGGVKTTSFSMSLTYASEEVEDVPVVDDTQSTEEGVVVQ